MDSITGRSSHEKGISVSGFPMNMSHVKLNVPTDDIL